MSSSTGTSAAQQCTTTGTSSAASTSTTVRSAARTTAGSIADNVPNPLAVGTEPRSTAGSAGSSSAITNVSRPGTRLRSSTTWPRNPSAKEAAMSRQAPGSDNALSPWRNSTAAASVHGPATAAFIEPR